MHRKKSDSGGGVGERGDGERFDGELVGEID